MVVASAEVVTNAPLLGLTAWAVTVAPLTGPNIATPLIFAEPVLELELELELEREAELELDPLHPFRIRILRKVPAKQRKEEIGRKIISLIRTTFSSDPTVQRTARVLHFF